MNKEIVIENKATKIKLFDLKSIQMRTFHITWFSFFLCFFGWFGIAPLMAVVREELSLTKAQIGNTILASVAITVLVRLMIGWLCDRIGPRISYTGLLILGSIPVMTIGLAQSYESFLMFRLAIGAIGASFVITQYHTSMMFASNCVGAANATTAGWGNLGGGVTQLAMPLILVAVLSLGINEYWGWRIAMIVPGIGMLIMGVVYYLFTTDYPEGNIKELREQGKLPPKSQSKGSFVAALKDPRVFALFIVYGACFGVELTINNIAALYFVDNFSLSLTTAGMIAMLFGGMNIFARTLGGYFSDRLAKNGGLKARVSFLFATLILEGIALIIFSQMVVLPLAIVTLIMFSLFVQMAEGATFSIVPFVNQKAIGSVSGIVGAGGNFGAVMFALLLKSEALTYSQGLFILGLIVVGCSACALAVRFSASAESEAKREIQLATAQT